MTVRWTARARQDLESQVEFIRADNPPAADRMFDRVQQTSALLEQWPELGTQLSARIRKLVIPRTPFILTYSIVEKDALLILRLYHGAQHRSDR